MQICILATHVRVTLQSKLNILSGLVLQLTQSVFHFMMRGFLSDALTYHILNAADEQSW